MGGVEEKPEGIGQREREMLGRIKTWNEWTKKKLGNEGMDRMTETSEGMNNKHEP